MRKRLIEASLGDATLYVYLFQAGQMKPKPSRAFHMLLQPCSLSSCMSLKQHKTWAVGCRLVSGLVFAACRSDPTILGSDGWEEPLFESLAAWEPKLRHSAEGFAGALLVARIWSSLVDGVGEHLEMSKIDGKGLKPASSPGVILTRPR